MSRTHSIKFVLFFFCLVLVGAGCGKPKPAQDNGQTNPTASTDNTAVCMEFEKKLDKEYKKWDFSCEVDTDCAIVNTVAEKCEICANKTIDKNNLNNLRATMSDGQKNSCIDTSKCSLVSCECLNNNCVERPLTEDSEKKLNFEEKIKNDILRLTLRQMVFDKIETAKIDELFSELDAYDETDNTIHIQIFSKKTVNDLIDAIEEMVATEDIIEFNKGLEISFPIDKLPNLLEIDMVEGIYTIVE